MAREERQAARRIRYLTPINAGKVLGNALYWTLPFLRRYLDRADLALRKSAEDGFLYAIHGPELARRVPTRGSSGYADDQEKQSYALVALGILGHAAHRYGELTKAQVSFAEGKILMREHSLLAGFVARFLWRQASFELALGQPVDQLLARASRLPADELDLIDRGRLALVKGKVALARGRGGGEALAEALRCSGTSRSGLGADLRDDTIALVLGVVRDRAIPLFAHHGMLHAVVQIRKAGVYTLPKRDQVRLLWIEGQVHCAQGLGRYGLRVLERASRWKDALRSDEAGLLTHDIEAARAAEE